MVRPRNAETGDLDGSALSPFDRSRIDWCRSKLLISMGLVKRAPPFLRRSGFEWVYRFVKEPRRLWRRYLSNNPLFLFLLALQASGLLKLSEKQSPTAKA